MPLFVRPGTSGGWTGQRVELNAMSSDQFIAWLERKFAEVGITKVVPDRGALENAYRRAVRRARVQEAIDEALSDLDEDEEMPVPDDLEERIRNKLKGSAKAWDQVLWDLVADDEIEVDEHAFGEEGDEGA